MTTRIFLTMVAGSALVALAVVLALRVVWFMPTAQVGEWPSAKAGVPEMGYEVPAFTLTDQAGAAFGREDLAGKVWIADFIFTRCPGPCPILSTNLGLVRDQLAESPGWDRLHLVSFSVDPEYDQPEVLRAYAQRYNATPNHWTFLTGERAAIWSLIEGGFKLGVGEASAHNNAHGHAHGDAPSNEGPITHSPKFVLVDQQGQIRGYYDGLNAEERAALIADARALAGEK